MSACLSVLDTQSEPPLKYGCFLSLGLVFDGDGPGTSGAVKHSKHVGKIVSETPSRVDQTAAPAVETGAVQPANLLAPVAWVDVAVAPENQFWDVHQRNAFFEAVKEVTGRQKDE